MKLLPFVVRCYAGVRFYTGVRCYAGIRCYAETLWYVYVLYIYRPQSIPDELNSRSPAIVRTTTDPHLHDHNKQPSSSSSSFPLQSSTPLQSSSLPFLPSSPIKSAEKSDRSEPAKKEKTHRHSSSSVRSQERKHKHKSRSSSKGRSKDVGVVKVESGEQL